MAVFSTHLRALPALLVLTGAAACGAPAASAGAQDPAPAAPQMITVTMTEFAFALDHPPTAAGAYLFHAVNAGKYPHAVELDGAGVSDQKSAVVQPGGSADLTVTLAQGALDVYCPVDGHRAKGMETHLTIGAASTGGGAVGY